LPPYPGRRIVETYAGHSLSNDASSLQQALADRYRIERELGRGGMATVFLARDLKHDRPVAFKVLHPELAMALGPERFLREIKLAARLQHPHILTVHDSGGAKAGAGPQQLWFTMPYVEGESLRGRLNREKQLPLEDALRITREAAQGLRYAHEHGVVHRDIKPENLLLTEDGNTLVADFGIARALASGDEERLTATGLAMGTPAYMSPEQASGSSEVDVRSDVYSLGCVLYEMLAGEPPFTGPTAQAMIAKRFAGPAPRVSVVRPGVPAAIVDAIDRALAAAPADRFATVNDFARALDVTSATTVVKPTLPAVRERRKRFVGSALVVATFALGYVALKTVGVLPSRSLIAAGALAPQDQLVLADFADRANDSSLATAVTEAFRVDFAQSGLVGLASTDRVRGALQRMQRSDSARLTVALAREVAVREGLKAVLSGEVTRLGDGYIISAQVVRADSGQVLAARRETATSSKDIIPSVDRLSRGLRGTVGEPLRRIQSAPPLAAVTTPSLEALRRYALGTRLISMGRDGEALPLLRQAVQLDTGFAMAWAQIWVALWSNQREPEAQIDAISRAYALRDRLTEKQRYATEAQYFEWAKRDRPRARAAWEALLAIEPTHAAALTDLGLLNWFEDDYEQAASLAARAIRSDSGQYAPYTNLVDAQVALKQYAAAETTLARWRGRFGAAGEYSYVVGHIAYVRGDYDAASRSWHSNLDQPGDDAERARAANMLARMATVRGRLNEARKLDRFIAGISPDPGQKLRLPIEEAKAQLGLGFRQEALATMDRLVKSPEFAAAPGIQRPYDEMALIYAGAGQTERARSLVAEQARVYEAAGTEGERLRTSIIHSMLAQGREGAVLLADKRFAEALDQFSRAHDALGGTVWLPEMGMALDRAGMTDSALVIYERYLSSTWLYRVIFDVANLGPVLRRVGEIYEAKGDSARAVQSYQRLLALWREADPAVQPQVTDIKRRLADLTREPQ
jgi:serine/threonine-protein kinase